MDSVKENVAADELLPTLPGVMSAKKQVQTPRQPLMDLKQVARPITMETLSKAACKNKPLTPLCTPKMRKTTRKIQPSALVYVEGETKANSKDGELEPVAEEELTQFVSAVITQCVRDLQPHTHDKSKSMTMTSEDSQGEEMGSDHVNKTGAETGAKLEVFDAASNEGKQDKVFQSSSTETEGACVEADNDTSDVAVHEDSLLGDVSQYTDCSNSFTESTKTEDELLASFNDSPAQVDKSDNCPSYCSETEEASCSVNMENCEPTPRLSFLEKVALTARVREASSSLASWVVQRGHMAVHLQREAGTARLVHDIACSPILPPETGAQPPPLPADTAAGATHRTGDTGATHRTGDTGATHHTGQASDTSHHTDTCTHTDADNGVEMTRELSQEWQTVTQNKADLVNASESIIETVEDIVAATECASPECLRKTEAAAESKSTGCSPMPVSVDEVGVQSVVEHQSVMCSPMCVSVCDTSTQHELHTQSIMCSPIPASVCDMSVQNVMETQSAMCSPMLIPVCDISIQHETETQSTMCSPIKMPVLDCSVQNVAETQSACCSPMVACPSQDKSVLVCGPALEDVGVGTERVLLEDAGITVAPQTSTVATDMHDLPMVHAGTSMTPIKLPNKQGKKLTAEDVRKQHPRVLANKLDTLLLENTRLEAQVRALDRQARKLATHEEVVRELEETRQRHNELREVYERESRHWQLTCDKLQADMAATTLQHQHQIVKLKEEYEATDYRDHFLASQKLVCELQADLEQYTKLVDDIDQSQKLQVELETVMAESWGKVKTATNKIVCMKQKLDEQVTDLSRQKAETRAEFISLEEQKAELQSHRREIAEMVTAYKQNTIELETKAEQSLVELTAAQDRITSLEADLHTVNQEVELQRENHSALTVEVCELRNREATHSGQLAQLQADLEQATQQLHTTAHRLTEVLESQEAAADDHRAAENTSQLAIVNLERTLEMRERDIDGLERELFECREVIYSQMEASKAADARLNTTSQQLHDANTHNITLRDCCAVLRGKEQELKGSLESVQEELQGTRDHATRLIKAQGTEITDCYTALSRLTDAMTGVLHNLNQRAGIQKVGLNASLGSAMDEITRSGGSLTTHGGGGDGGQNSLVSQILHAAQCVEAVLDTAATANTTQGSHTDANVSLSASDNKHQNQSTSSPQKVDMSKTQSDQKIAQNENSAFVPMQPGVHEPVSQCADQCGATDDVSVAGVSESGVSESGVSVAGVSVAGVSVGLGGVVVGRAGESCLVPQVDKMSGLFHEIMRVAHLLEKALKSSLNDVREENGELNCRMFQCEYAERRLQAELELRQSEVSKSRSSVKQLEANLEDMGERLSRAWDNQVDVKQQQLEVRGLRGKIASLEGEKELLNEQITELLQQLEAGGQPRDAAHTSKHVLKLQKKVERYRAMQLENDSRMEELSTKAARRINKLTDNWRKADSEVCRLDELVDIIRRELVDSEALRRDTRLQKLVNMIDGVESLSGAKSKAGELKPVKTAKW